MSFGVVRFETDCFAELTGSALHVPRFSKSTALMEMVGCGLRKSVGGNYQNPSRSGENAACSILHLQPAL
jgi:hypothetical protein